MLTRWFLPLALAAATLAGAPPAGAQEPSFDSAAALQKSGDFEEAAAAYRRFLDAHPANVEARSNLGVVLMRLGRYEEAIAAYQTALSIDSWNPTVRLNLGLAYYKSDQLADAVQTFKRVLPAQPDNLQARYLAADCQLRLGRPSEAISLLTPLEASRADDPTLSYLLGMAYLSAKEIEKGQLLIDRILRHGDSAQARVMMGVAKRGAGDLKGAAEDLKVAVGLDPDLPGVHGLYALALLESGNPDLARPEFEAELSRNPLDFDAHLNLGVLLKAEQDYDARLPAPEPCARRQAGRSAHALSDRQCGARPAGHRGRDRNARGHRQGSALVHRSACRARDGVLPGPAQGRRRSRASHCRAPDRRRRKPRSARKPPR